MSKHIKDLDEKILKLLCEDNSIGATSIKLKCCKSTIEKRINLLKDYYQVNTLPGLIYKYTIKKIENEKI